MNSTPDGRNRSFLPATSRRPPEPGREDVLPPARRGRGRHSFSRAASTGRRWSRRAGRARSLPPGRRVRGCSRPDHQPRPYDRRLFPFPPHRGCGRRTRGDPRSPRRPEDDAHPDPAGGGGLPRGITGPPRSPDAAGMTPRRNLRDVPASVSKGAALFRVWTEKELRPTRDVDFLAAGGVEPPTIRAARETVCAIPCPEDGVVFDAATLRIRNIRRDRPEGGLPSAAPGQPRRRPPRTADGHRTIPPCSTCPPHASGPTRARRWSPRSTRRW